MKKLTTLALALAFSAPVHAGDWRCENGGNERIIRVQYETEGSAVPCMVVYDKITEGGTEYPWNAKGQAGYCEEKADYLKERLEGFGWTCAALTE